MLLKYDIAQQRFFVEEIMGHDQANSNSGPSGEHDEGPAQCRAVGPSMSATPDDTTMMSVPGYATENCLTTQLRDIIWPADALARQMLDKVRRTLQQYPPDKRLPDLFLDFFAQRQPNVLAIQNVYSRLVAAFQSNDYTWRCTSCPSWPEEQFGESFELGLIGHVGSMKLCMNNLKKYPLEGTAKTMIHEMGHRKLELKDMAYCSKDPSDPSGCPSSLVPEDALVNADSFACFAVRVWKLSD